MADIALIKLAETDTTITFGWVPVGNRGYRFTREKAGGKWSNTWDPNVGLQNGLCTARFSKDSAWYKVEALGLAATGTYPAPTPPPPPPPAVTITQDLPTLTGKVTWEAHPSEAADVMFFIDGIGKWTEHVTPYIFNGDGGLLDTTTLANGNHEFEVRATTSDGRTGSAKVTKMVTNAAPPPPPPPGAITITEMKGVSANYAVNKDEAVLASLGVKDVRCDWPSAARVSAAKAAGLRVMPIAGYNLRWVSGQGDKWPPTDWGYWITALKDAYANAWQKPPAVEIWNEPWLATGGDADCAFWCPKSDPAAYVKLVILAAQAIWGINPDCKIVFSLDYYMQGSRNPAWNSGPGAIWQNLVLAADTGKFLADSRMRPSTHNYTQKSPPDSSLQYGWGFDRYKLAYDALKAHGHPNPMVWVTEWGWESQTSGQWGNNIVTEQQQSDYTAAGMKKMLASGIVERAFNFFLRSGDTWAYNWLRMDGSQKPVCAAVKAL